MHFRSFLILAFTIVFSVQCVTLAKSNLKGDEPIYDLSNDATVSIEGYGIRFTEGRFSKDEIKLLLDVFVAEWAIHLGKEIPVSKVLHALSQAEIHWQDQVFISTDPDPIRLHGLAFPASRLAAVYDMRNEDEKCIQHTSLVHEMIHLILFDVYPDAPGHHPPGTKFDVNNGYLWRPMHEALELIVEDRLGGILGYECPAEANHSKQ